MKYAHKMKFWQSYTSLTEWLVVARFLCQVHLFSFQKQRLRNLTEMFKIRLKFRRVNINRFFVDSIRVVQPLVETVFLYILWVSQKDKEKHRSSRILAWTTRPCCTWLWQRCIWTGEYVITKRRISTWLLSDTDYQCRKQ